MQDGQSTLFFHSDHLGSASVITDDTTDAGGNISIPEEAAYFPFGKTRPESTHPNGGVNYKYTGQERDAETARLYDAALGRFAMADPIVPGARNPQSFNRYSDVRNNPMNFVDPSGYAPSYWWNTQTSNTRNTTSQNQMPAPGVVPGLPTIQLQPETVCVGSVCEMAGITATVQFVAQIGGIGQAIFTVESMPALRQYEADEQRVTNQIIAATDRMSQCCWGGNPAPVFASGFAFILPQADFSDPGFFDHGEVSFDAGGGDLLPSASETFSFPGYSTGEVSLATPVSQNGVPSDYAGPFLSNTCTGTACGFVKFTSEVAGPRTSTTRVIVKNRHPTQWMLVDMATTRRGFDPSVGEYRTPRDPTPTGSARLVGPLDSTSFLVGPLAAGFKGYGSGHFEFQGGAGSGTWHGIPLPAQNFQ